MNEVSINRVRLAMAASTLSLVACGSHVVNDGTSAEALVENIRAMVQEPDGTFTVTCADGHVEKEVFSDDIRSGFVCTAAGKSLKIDIQQDRGGISNAYAAPDYDSVGVAVSQEGACKVLRMPKAPFIGSIHTLDAGALTFLGGNFPSTFKPTWTGGGYTYDFDVLDGLPHPWFQAGDAISIGAAGGADIGAFSKILTAPTELVIQLPAVDTAVPRGSDLDIPWLPLNQQLGPPVASTVVELKLQAAADTSTAYAEAWGVGGSFLARCEFDATLGTGHIPRAILAGLPSGPTQIIYAVKSSTSWNQNNVDVTVELEVDGNVYGGGQNVVLQ